MVAAYRRYPPTVCKTPLGFPVEPLRQGHMSYHLISSNYEVHFKSNAHTTKNQSNLFIQVNFHITSFNVVPLASMTHFQRSGTFLMPSSRLLEFSSQIRRVMAKFRSFKVEKRQPLGRSFNFMTGTHVWRIKGWGSTSHA